MNQVARKEPEAVPVVQSESAAFVSMIERAARDPSVDMDKLERLLSMQERVIERNARAAYAAALANMQQELPVIAQRGEIRIGTGKPQKYALWEDINEAIKPVLVKHGFALSFRTGQQDTKISVTGVLSHREGHSEETTIYLPADTSGSKNAVQAVGSSTSYGKRYTASALLNLTTRGEDTDGNEPGGTITEKQGEIIGALVVEAKADIAKFLKWIGAESISDIPAKKFAAAVAMLETKKRGK